MTAQAVAAVAFCVSWVDTALCQKLEKQLSGETAQRLEQKEIRLVWKQQHEKLARLAPMNPETLPFPGPWMDSNDNEALRWYFWIFDRMIFESRVGRIANVEWSPLVEGTGCTNLDLITGQITIKIRSQSANHGVYNGDAAVAVMAELLGQMSWAHLLEVRCTCEACNTRLLTTMGLEKHEWKWIRLQGLVLRLASRNLGLRFKNGFPIALEKSDDNQ